MYIVDYFKSFFDFDRLTQTEFLVRYLTLLALSAMVIAIDERLITEINSDFIIIPGQAWTDDGYLFRKVISLLSLIIFWLGLRRFKDILNVKSINILPFSLFVLISMSLSYYGYEIILFILLLFVPQKKVKK